MEHGVWRREMTAFKMTKVTKIEKMRPVAEKDKQWRPLQKMFVEVPKSYDLMNRLLTLRFDERWREKAARECLAGNPARVLDLCTGTGDLAIRIARLAGEKTEIIGLDYSDNMLSIARQKAIRKGFELIKFINGDVVALPFDNESIDVIGIAFGFRNLTYKNPDSEIFLKEIYRVLVPEGRLIIVETSQPYTRILRLLFYVYLKVFVAIIGGWISGLKSAYKYLAESARNFYSPEEVGNLLLKKGFAKVQHKRLTGGIAGITTALK